MVEVESPQIERVVVDDEKREEIVFLSSIKKYSSNCKKHPESQLKAIENAILKIGYRHLIEIDEDNIILAGHGRFEVLQRLNKDGRYNRIKVVRQFGMSDFEKKTYRIAHNKLNMATGFDEVMLNEELEFLEDNGFDLEATGFSTLEVGEMRDKIQVSEHERKTPSEDNGVCSKCGQPTV